MKTSSNAAALLRPLTLLLPVLIPSWRFFDEVRPSPRIEFTLFESAEAPPRDWQEFRPRPTTLSVREAALRLLWNPRWNESLFLVSCAERLTENPTEHSQQEILKRIRADLRHRSVDAPYLQFRLVFLSREGGEMRKDVTFTSPVHADGA